MPEVMTKSTTVYTLAELEELLPSVYEDALQNIIQIEWEWFEPDDITYDMKENIIEVDYPWFELNERKFEWDMNNKHVQGEGGVDLRQFMRLTKLDRKYRSLYWGITVGGFEPCATARFGTGYYRNNDHVELADLEWDIECYIDNPKRKAKMLEQCKIVEKEIDDYVGTMYDRLRTLLFEEEKYRCSEEFAREEAEAHEWTFTESGKIYH